VGRHIVGSLVVVDPGAGFRRQLGEPFAQIAQHVGIRVLLDYEAGRRVLDKNRAQRGVEATALDDGLDLGRDVRETTPGGANLHDFLIGAQLAPDYAIIRGGVPAPEIRTSSYPPARPSLRGVELGTFERRLDALSRRHRITHVAFMLCQVLVRRDIAAATSAMAFDLFLAAIPMLALSGWLFGKLLLGNHESVLQTTALLLNLTPNEVQAITWQQLDRFALGSVAPFALLGALWAASGAFHTSMGLLEASAGTVRRPWWRKRVLALVIVLVSIVLFGSCALFAVWVSLGPARLLVAISGGDVLLNPGATHYLLLGLLALLGVLLLALFFFVASPRPGVRRRVFPGAIVAVVAGSCVSGAFAFYAGHLARFALFYGSLAAVAVTLAWLWFVCFSFLVGAELNQLLENGE
jgi:membrane protein